MLDLKHSQNYYNLRWIFLLKEDIFLLKEAKGL